MILGQFTSVFSVIKHLCVNNGVICFSWISEKNFAVFVALQPESIERVRILENLIHELLKENL